MTGRPDIDPRLVDELNAVEDALMDELIGDLSDHLEGYVVECLEDNDGDVEAARYYLGARLVLFALGGGPNASDAQRHLRELGDHFTDADLDAMTVGEAVAAYTLEAGQAALELVNLDELAVDAFARSVADQADTILNNSYEDLPPELEPPLSYEVAPPFGWIMVALGRYGDSLEAHK
ncbi:MAG: hypothetical protein ACF8PN_05055 [Phycisphaerales bacterium]